VRRFAAIVLAAVAMNPGATRPAPHAPQPDTTAEARAVAYLSREVPGWRREHPCYSCHNNGDAARALIAVKRSRAVAAALDDTLRWLGDPDRWESNGGGEGGGDDKRLARIQFAHAATAASAAALVDKRAVARAAAIVAADQRPDGSWQLDSSDSIGSPATYGTALATLFARRTLSASGQSSMAGPVARADRWLAGLTPTNSPDAAAILFAFADAPPAQRPAGWDRSLELVAKGQGRTGGWGPYATSPAEPFDTALVVLALHDVKTRRAPSNPTFTAATLEQAIARGRRYLLSEQLEDGSWRETTRPAGQTSYAQRISTTAWALLALVETGDAKR
jgi:hypothetical protein